MIGPLPGGDLPLSVESAVLRGEAATSAHGPADTVQFTLTQQAGGHGLQQCREEVLFLVFMVVARSGVEDEQVRLGQCHPVFKSQGGRPP